MIITLKTQYGDYNYGTHDWFGARSDPNAHRTLCISIKYGNKTKYVYEAGFMWAFSGDLVRKVLSEIKKEIENLTKKNKSGIIDVEEIATKLMKEVPQDE